MGEEIDRLRDEVQFWRKEAAAQLFFLHCEYLGAEQRGDQDAMLKLKVGRIDPIVHAFRDADAGRFHAYCEACDKPVKHGQAVIYYEDAGEIHADCDNPDAVSDNPEARSYDDCLRPDKVVEIVARARTLSNEEPS